LQQVEKFKYLGVVFASDGSRNKEVDTPTGKADAVLRKLDRSVVTKRELFHNAILSSFKSVFDPIIPYGYESLIMTEGTLSQVQAAENEILRSVHGVKFRDKARSHEFGNALNVQQLILRSQRLYSLSQERLAR